MGCDIHTIVEIKKQNKWIGLEECPEEFNERNYSTFAFLTNVRNRFNTKGFEPKGKPVEMSEESSKLFEKWEDDGHSQSYLTLKELDEFDKSDYYSRKCRVVGEFIKMLKEFGGTIPEQMEIEEIKPTSFIDLIKMSFCPDVIVKWQAPESEQKETPLYKGIESLKKIANKNEIENFEDIRIVFVFDN